MVYQITEFGIETQYWEDVTKYFSMSERPNLTALTALFKIGRAYEDS